MKIKKIVTIILCVLLLGVTSGVKSAQGEISIEPVTKKIMKNETIRIDLRARNLPDVYALSFEVNYESAVLNFEKFEWGSFVDGEVEPFKDCSNPKPGKMIITVSHRDSKTNLSSGSKTICTLIFKGIMPSKKSPLEIEKVVARTMAFKHVELSTRDSAVEVYSPPTKPMLVVRPTELDFGTLQIGQSKTLKVKISNDGKEGLNGTTECYNIWLSSKPITFNSDEIEIEITAKPPEEGLRLNRTYKGRCSIFTNGGSKDVVCKFYLQEKAIEDVIPPDLTIDEPKDGMITNKSMIMIRGRTNPGVTLKINRMPREIASDGSFEHELMLLEGDNKIIFHATNEKGGVTNKEIHVTLDSMEPVLSVDEPANVVHKNPLTVTGITEAGAIVKAGGKPIKADAKGKFSVQFQLNSGENNLAITVVDDAGNSTSWSKTVQLVLQETVKVIMWIGQPQAYVNGESVYLKVPPTIKNGRTFVPVRFVSESLRSEVKWDGDTRSVTVVGPNHTCIVMIDQTTAFLDGALLKLDAAPFIQNDTTLVPLRFIAQDTLGGVIVWDGDEKRIDITVTFDISE